MTKYTKQDVIEKRISFEPMSEEQLEKLKKHFGYGPNWEDGVYYRFYSLKNFRENIYGSNHTSFTLSDGGDFCTKEISFEEFDFEENLKEMSMTKYTKKDVIEKRISFKPMEKEQYEKLRHHFNYPFTHNYFPNMYYRFYPKLNTTFLDSVGLNNMSYLNLDGINYNVKSHLEISFEEFDFEEKLPQYFAVKSEESEHWYKFINWLNKKYSTHFTGDSHQYYGFDGEGFCADNLEDCKNVVIVVTIDFWKRAIDAIEKIKTEKLPENFVIRAAEEISLWKEFLAWLNKKYKSDIHDGYEFVGVNYGKPIYANNMREYASNSTTLTLNRWKELVDKDELVVENNEEFIIGYKLIRSEFKIPVIHLLDVYKRGWWNNYADFNFKDFGYHVPSGELAKLYGNEYFFHGGQTITFKQIMNHAGIQHWFVPVYKPKYKKGDKVFIIDNAGSDWLEKGEVVELGGQYWDALGLNEKNFCYVSHKKPDGGNSALAIIYRLATAEEIEKSETKTVSVGGKFNVKIQNNKVYHQTSDITDFVIELVEYFKKNNENYKYTFGSFRANIHDITFSKTGCEHTETKLSDWKAIYNMIKKKS